MVESFYKRIPLWKRASAVVCAVTMANVVVATKGPSGNMYEASINNPPRLQWEANDGYCGEVSMISAGLRYGQYCSQYDARALASNNTPQYRADSQLLLGVNDMWAASQMHLKAKAYDNSGGPDAPAFLTWVKNGVLSNSSVIMAIYNNECLLYDKSNPKAGNGEYDHIVPVIGVSSNFPLQRPAAYHADDTITFSDNGLYTPSGPPSYIYQYQDGSFQRNRQQANAKGNPIYSLPSSVKNYGLVISGPIDEDGQTLPVSLATSLNYEKPRIKDGSNTRPMPENVTLTITVDSLKPGQTYNLYRYNSFSSVPNSSFNANRAQATASWQIQADNSTHVLTETILSNQIAVYRAVPVAAP